MLRDIKQSGGRWELHKTKGKRPSFCLDGFWVLNPTEAFHAHQTDSFGWKWKSIHVIKQAVFISYEQTSGMFGSLKVFMANGFMHPANAHMTGHENLHS